MTRTPSAYPDLIRPGPWKVKPWRPDGTGTPPCTDIGSFEMWVPAGNGAFAREVRFHENLHVAKSPETVPTDTGASHMSLLAAEDCRVNIWGRDCVRPHDALGTGPQVDVFALATQKTVRAAAQLAAACCGYTGAEAWFDRVETELRRIARLRTVPEWARTHATAMRHAIARVRMKAPGFIEPVTLTDFSDAVRLARWLDRFDDAMPQPPADMPPEDHDYDEAPEDGGDASKAVWGEMKVETPPLPVSHATSIGRRTTPSLSGARIQNWNRRVTGEVFGRSRKRGVPDAVLLDQSRSMHWDPAKLLDLVKRMPVGIVAGYAGSGGHGTLRILAKDGRMVAPDHVVTPGYGNEVDGPALRWLAKQPGRRIWVSDQGVCSDVCDSEQALLADCKQVMQAGGIRTCLTTDPATIMQALRKR
jgi:hypothetical protein